MVKPAKIISLALVAVLVTALVAGIAYWSVGYNPDAIEPGLYENGDKKNAVDTSGPVLTVGGHEVSFDMYRYYYLVTKASYEYSDPTYFDHDPDGSISDGLKEYVEYILQQQYTWLAIADELGIELTDEDLADIDSQIAEDKASYGSDFETQLANSYIASEDLYRQIMVNQTLTTKAQEEFEERVSAESEDDVLASIVSVKHILITPSGYAARQEEYDALMAGTAQPGDATADEPADDETADADDLTDNVQDELDEPEEPANGEEEEPAEVDTVDYDAGAKAFADWLRDEIEASEDPIATFEQFRALYDEDAAGQGEDGYTFGEGTMVEEFYAGSLALEVDEISEPVATTYGYHTILRLPLDQTYVDENLESLTYNAVSAVIQAKYDEVMETMELEYGAYYDKIQPNSVK